MRFLILIILLFSCEKERYCDTSFRSYNLFSEKRLEYITIKDITNDTIIGEYHNIQGSFELINDNYFKVIKPNNVITVNLNYKYVNDSVDLRVVGFCVITDDCHVQPTNLDTLK